ncbi:MAG: cobalamin-dependent protein [Acidimicrobiia bacterium]|nr:cobalamin-dependent protein [Acidimicrobiia bacterium]
MGDGRPRILLAKPGLDGHDRGLKVIAYGLRDAGAEVIYLGLRRTVAQILDAAIDEDVDVIGVSILSGAHLALGRNLLAGRDERGVGDLPVVFGGTIPGRDADELRSLGAADVFGVGSELTEVIAAILRVAAHEVTAT